MTFKPNYPISPRFGFFVALLLGSSSLFAQSLVDNIDQITSQLSPGPLQEVRLLARSAQDTTPAPDILGIFAAYAYDNKTDALSHSYSPSAIFESYKNNPYLAPLFKDSSLVVSLVNQYDSTRVFNTIESIRSGQREMILSTLTSSDVYSGNRMLKPRLVLSDYQQPTVNNKNALDAAAESAHAGLSGDPVSFTATFLSGLADWIAQRAQAELVQTFLIRLQEDLSDKQLNVLFPNTYQYLGQLDVANYKSIIANARLAFAEDLNSLSLNVSDYLYATGTISESNTVAFNLLLVYRLVDLAQQELPFTDILAYTNGEFSRRRFDNEKMLHNQIADNPTDTNYIALEKAFDATYPQLVNTYNKLALKQVEISQKLSKINPGIQSLFPKLYKDATSLDNSLQQVNFNTVFRNSDNKFLAEISGFLKGKLNYDVLVNNPTIQGYQDNFLTSLPSAEDLRSVGLTMIRELLNPSQGQAPVISPLQEFLASLKQLDTKVQNLETLWAASQQTKIQAADNLLNGLIGTLNTEETFWKSKENTVGEHNWRAIEYLKNLSANELLTLNKAKQLPAGQIAAAADKIIQFIEYTKRLFVQHLQSLQASYPQFSSPYLQSLKIVDPYKEIETAITQSAQSLKDLKDAFINLESSGANAALYKSYNNASLFGNVLEAGTQLLYCLSVSQPGSNSITWISPNQLAQVMNNPTQRQLFLGILYQRISTLTGTSTVDSRGIAEIAGQVVQDLAQLKAKSDSKFTDKILFAMEVINAILETPLIRDDNDPTKLISLITDYEQNKKSGINLSLIPQVNSELAELFQRTADKEYRYALSNVINLLDIFTAYPNGSKKQKRWQDELSENNQQIKDIQQLMLNPDLNSTLIPKFQSDIQKISKRNKKLQDKVDSYVAKKKDYIVGESQTQSFRDKLFRYGHFIADIAAADSTYDVQAAIENIALPVGSSQNKRIQSSNVSLNAYFGGTMAKEHILNLDDFNTDSLSNDGVINSFGLFVPVGIAVSWKFQGQRNSSFSLFGTILDLGALSAYRLDNSDSEIDILPDFNFANVLAPGLHLFYNFPKSPFFLGAGFQLGPNVREFKLNGQTESFRSMRYMLSFGIDVPILSFSGN